MARTATTATTALHQRTAREVHAARDGELGDGGGLTLRIGAAGASWVLRFTSPAGKRREMGLGLAERGTVARAGQSLTAARDQAHKAREMLRQGIDPIDERNGRRGAAQAQDAAKKAAAALDHWTLARCARDYHERVIERTRTAKHSAQWISSLEHHMPPAVWHASIATITPPALLEALTAATPHERARRPGDLGETLRRVRQRLDSVFEDAMFFGRCASNPAAAIKRKLRETRPAGDRGEFLALDYPLAPVLMARIRAMPGTAARCLEFAVLTASRTSEALLASWGRVRPRSRRLDHQGRAHEGGRSALRAVVAARCRDRARAGGPGQHIGVPLAAAWPRRQAAFEHGAAGHARPIGGA